VDERLLNGLRVGEKLVADKRKVDTPRARPLPRQLSALKHALKAETWLK
jgi:hypothetical protein